MTRIARGTTAPTCRIGTSGPWGIAFLGDSRNTTRLLIVTIVFGIRKKHSIQLICIIVDLAVSYFYHLVKLVYLTFVQIGSYIVAFAIKEPSVKPFRVDKQE